MSESYFKIYTCKTFKLYVWGSSLRTKAEYTASLQFPKAFYTINKFNLEQY